MRNTRPIDVVRHLTVAIAVLGCSLWPGPPASATPSCFGARPTITGTDKDERLKGTTRADVIFGGGGDDEIEGLGGSDILCGGTGDDDVNGGWGSDAVFGGVGADHVLGGLSKDVVYGNEDRDSLDGGKGLDAVSYVFAAHGVTASLLTGRASGEGGDRLDGVEILIGSQHDDYLVGDARNNVLAGLQGADFLAGGAGSDTVSYLPYYNSDDVHADLAAHHATGHGKDEFSSIENLQGGLGEDVLAGDDGPNVIDGLDGINELYGRGGNDTLTTGGGPISGGAGDDVIVGRTATYEDAPQSMQIDLSLGTAVGEGSDRIAVDQVLGSSFDDSIVGSDGDDYLNGGDGADTIDGAAGRDSVSGGAGDDTLRGGFGEDVMGGDIGEDILYGDADRDMMAGDAGGDRLFGGDGSDLLSGDNFDEQTPTSVGNDFLDGEGGDDDFAMYEGNDQAVTVDLAAGTATGQGTDTLSRIEGVIGSPWSDTLSGDDQPNIIGGMAGGDTINGLGGDDYLAGDDNNDGLDGGDGTDICLSAEWWSNCEKFEPPRGPSLLWTGLTRDPAAALDRVADDRTRVLGREVRVEMAPAARLLGVGAVVRLCRRYAEHDSRKCRQDHHTKRLHPPS